MGIIEDTIQSGGFGYNAPNPNLYNPYNNVVPMQTQYIQQPIYGFQQVQQPVFANYPIGYQQPYYGYGSQQGLFGGDYYNPYGMSSYGYGYSPQAYQYAQQQEKNMLKLKYRGAFKILGKEIDEEKLERTVNYIQNPNYYFNYQEKTQEEIRDFSEYQYFVNVSNYVNSNGYMVPTLDMMAGNNVLIRSLEFHKYFDDHSLVEFLEEDLWRLEREEWIKENVNRNGTRNLKATYNSKDYNELLAMHRSNNPYINQLMDDSRYDNNKFDDTVGMNIVLDKERRRTEFLRQKLPTYISDEETQRRRHEWTEKILQGIYDNRPSGFPQGLSQPKGGGP